MNNNSSNMTDILEEYIKKLFSESPEDHIIIKRSNVAQKFDCVPSQLNYVIKTRFTPEHGFIIESKRGKYQYEMLRLDDPLAMTIGTLSNCCQELHNIAEMCMEHSMVDQNGRIFLVKDDIGNVVAQSWVWRNKDVICFDNIEIPNRAISREVKS